MSGPSREDVERAKATALVNALNSMRQREAESREAIRKALEAGLAEKLAERQEHEGE